MRSEEVKDENLTGVDIDESTLAIDGDTPQELLGKLLTVDGPGSTLTADALDGLDSSNLYTKSETDDRYALSDAGFSMVSTGGSGSYAPFVSWAQLDFACSASGEPSVSLKNVSGSNLRVYTDTGEPPLGINAPLANGASTAVTANTTGDGRVDRVTYLTRGPLGTVRLESWYEDIAGNNNCVFSNQAFGQAIGLALAG